LNTEKGENVDVDAPKEVEVEIKPEIDRKKSIGENTFKFLDYFIYKVTFGKKYDNIKIYENFRKKIISVENLMQIYGQEVTYLCSFAKTIVKLVA